MATSILDLSPEQTAEGAESDDLRLVESLREGSEWAYEELLTRFQQPVYTLALRLLNNQSEACDVVQEVFLKVFRKIDFFRGDSSLKTWIYRIALREASNQRRWWMRHKQQEVAIDQEMQGQMSLYCQIRRPLFWNLCDLQYSMLKAFASACDSSLFMIASWIEADGPNSSAYRMSFFRCWNRTLYSPWYSMCVVSRGQRSDCGVNRA